MEPMNIGIMLGVREDPEESLEQCRRVGVTCAQLGCPPDDWFNVNKARDVAAMFADAGVLITTVFAGFAGESYSDIPTVQRTVGYLPEAMREERIVKTFQVAEFARAMGVSRIAAHFGFIPEDPCDVRYSACVETMRRICDYLEAKGMSFGLETGQETAGTLVRFLEDVGVDNLNVNFDPANMILYGTEDPIESMPSSIEAKEVIALQRVTELAKSLIEQFGKDAKYQFGGADFAHRAHGYKGFGGNEGAGYSVVGAENAVKMMAKLGIWLIIVS